ncbi:MAG: ATP-binding protein [Cyanobacteria bacterium P01_G01_bin.39]
MNNDRILTTPSSQQEKKEPGIVDQEAELASITASMVHDLQAPLRSLTMFTELLAQEYQAELDDQAQQYLSRIADSGSRIQTLIEELLAYSRAGRAEQTWVTVDFNQVIEKVKLNLQSEIAKTNATITVQKLPQLLVNPQELQQLWQNLLENALKYSAETTPKIEISASTQGQEWLFAIADNGIGIAPEFHRQIFEVFQRLHSRDAYPGHGIGLAICTKIVKRYGGKIGVESQVGFGSTFYFTLPMNTCPQPPLPLTS